MRAGGEGGKRLGFLSHWDSWAASPAGGLMATSASQAKAVCCVSIGQRGLSFCQDVRHGGGLEVNQ